MCAMEEGSPTDSGHENSWRDRRDPQRRGSAAAVIWAFVPPVGGTEAPKGYVHREPEKMTSLGIRLFASSPFHLLQGHRPLFSGPR